MGTTIAVDGTGYADAAGSLRFATVLATGGHRDLVEGLTGRAARVGDARLAGDLATAYDGTARLALAVHTALAHALADYGLRTATCLANHVRAEAASRYDPRGTGLRGLEPDHGVDSDPSDWEVHPDARLPPSSIGGDDGSLPNWAREILEQVAAFVWPTAQTETLHVAAGAWTRGVDALDGVHDQVVGAASALGLERSPEIPLAQDALAALRRDVGDLQAAHRTLAATCTTYAEQVTAGRTAILDLAASVRDSLLDADLDGLRGLAAPPLLGLTLADAALDRADAVRDATPRFLAILDDLRSAADEHAHTLQATSASLAGLHGRLRDGALGFDDNGRPYDPTTWLGRHEGGEPDGHTIRAHVGLTDAELRERLAAHPRLPAASTYTDEAVATDVIKRALDVHEARIKDWIEHPGRPEPVLELTTEEVVGRVLKRDDTIVTSTNIVVVLRRDPEMPDGYRILTSYPELP